MWGDNGRQGGGRQGLGKADAPSNTGTHVGRQWETRGGRDKGRGRQGLGRADTLSNTGTHDLGKADTPSNTKPDTLRKH